MQLYLVILLAKHLTNAHTVRGGKGRERRGLWGSASRGDLPRNQTANETVMRSRVSSGMGCSAAAGRGDEEGHSFTHAKRTMSRPILEAG